MHQDGAKLGKPMRGAGPGKLKRLAANVLSIGPQLTGWDMVRVALGLLLIAAAVLKGRQLLTEPVLERGILTSRWFLISFVDFELLFGDWLLFGLWPRATWLTALLCFSGFAAVALWQGLAGEASCGCFGKVQVSPCVLLLLELEFPAVWASITPKRRAIP